MWAIIGGSGLYSLPFLQSVTLHDRTTPWGSTTGTAVTGVCGSRQLLFMNRHGADHDTPPHLVNYRANLHKLSALGATRVLAIGAVGGIAQGLNVGDLVLPTQVIDYTWGREATYYVGGGAGVTHVDFTEPFDADIRQAALDAASRAGIRLRSGGVCAVTQGPRLETAAEIDRLDKDGATIVGMTTMPEAVLARELNLPYALLAVVVNRAAGRGTTPIHEGLQEALDRVTGAVSELLQALLAAAQ